MNRDDLLGSDEALDRSLAALGVPPDAAPAASASVILAGAGLAAPAVITGMATWKVVSLVTLGTLFGSVSGVFGGFFLNTALQGEAPTSIPQPQELIALCDDLDLGEDAAAAVLPTVEDVEEPGEPSEPFATTAEDHIASGASPVSVQPRIVADRGHTSTAPPAQQEDRVEGVRDDPAELALREGCPELPQLEEDWVPEPGDYEPAEPWTPTDIATEDVRTPDEGPLWSAPGGPSRRSHLRIAGGLATNLGTWENHMPAAGPALEIGVAFVGPSTAPMRPLALVGAHGALMVESDRATRFVGGARAGGGVAMVGPRTRLELAWTLAAHGMPPIHDTETRFVPGAGRVWLTTGPHVGLTFTPDSGPAIHVAATIHGSAMKFEAEETAEIQPSIGIAAGIEVPLGK